MILPAINKPMKFAINLHLVSRKLGIPAHTLVEVLQDAGFRIFNLPTTILTEKHLLILANAYADSVVSYYNSSLKNYHTLNEVEQGNLRRFFARFLHDSFFCSITSYEESLDKVFTQKLDTGLIKDFFFNLMQQIAISQSRSRSFFIDSDASIDSSSAYKSLKKISHRLKLKIKVKNINNSDFRIKLHSILICSHYHIFSDDENHKGEALPKISFSDLFTYFEEALKCIHNLKQSKKWMILNPL